MRNLFFSLEVLEESMDEVRRESTENQNGNEYKNVWPANYAAIL